MPTARTVRRPPASSTGALTERYFALGAELLFEALDKLADPANYANDAGEAPKKKAAAKKAAAKTSRKAAAE